MRNFASAVDVSALVLDMPGRLGNLGNSYSRRLEHRGNVTELSDTIFAQQRAIQLTPYGHIDMPARLHNLGVSFLCRFERTGDLSDLSEAITTKQCAVRLTPNDHFEMPRRSGSLGYSFQRRFEHTGDISDLKAAISYKQRAVQLTPDGHQDIPARLNNLGISFLSYFEYTGDVEALTKAISTQQQAVQLIPCGHPDLPGWLSNLAMLHCRHFECTCDVSDLGEAILAQQRAVRLTHDGHIAMPGRLANLGTLFRCRFEHTGNASDLKEATSTEHRAVQLAPNFHPISARPTDLENSFHHRFKRMNGCADIRTAISTFTNKISATTFGPPSACLYAAQRWTELSTIHDHPYTLKAYGIAIDLLSEIAGMDRTIEQRHASLTEISILTTSAASAAFSLGKFEKALEWLEQGRCLVWSQLDQLRTPLDQLREHDAHLAQRFSDISNTLEVSSSRRSEGLSIDAPLSQKISSQDDAHLHIKLSREWSELLDKIRCIPDLHNFLRPPQASYLLQHLPQEGIVVLVNVHKSRCDALALVSSTDAPIHIPLDDFTHELASKLRDWQCRLLYLYGFRTEIPPAPPQEIGALPNSLHYVLKTLWLCVVRPILDGLAFSVSISQFLTYHFVNFIFPSLLLHQTLSESGGVQLVPWHFCHSMLQESIVSMGNPHQAPAFRILQSLPTRLLSTRSFRSSRSLLVYKNPHCQNSLSSANQIPQAYLHSLQPQRKWSASGKRLEQIKANLFV